MMARQQRRARPAARPLQAGLADRHVRQHQRGQQPHTDTSIASATPAATASKEVRQHQEEAEEEDHVARGRAAQRLQRHQHHQHRHARDPCRGCFAQRQTRGRASTATRPAVAAAAPVDASAARHQNSISAVKRRAPGGQVAARWGSTVQPITQAGTACRARRAAGWRQPASAAAASRAAARNEGQRHSASAFRSARAVMPRPRRLDARAGQAVQYSATLGAQASTQGQASPTAARNRRRCCRGEACQSSQSSVHCPPAVSRLTSSPPLALLPQHGRRRACRPRGSPGDAPSRFISPPSAVGGLRRLVAADIRAAGSGGGALRRGETSQPARPAARSPRRGTGRMGTRLDVSASARHPAATRHGRQPRRLLDLRRDVDPGHGRRGAVRRCQAVPAARRIGEHDVRARRLAGEHRLGRGAAVRPRRCRASGASTPGRCRPAGT